MSANVATSNPEPAWDLGPQRGSSAGGAYDFERASQRLDPIRQSPEAGSGGRVCAADAVVPHFDGDARIARGHLDAHRGCMGVLRDVGQRFGDQVIGSRFDRLRQPLGGVR